MPDGQHPWCKTCRNEVRKARYARNPNKELKQNAQWRKANHERQLYLQRRHYQDNKHVYTEKSIARSARLKDATPPWFSLQDRGKVKELYRIAALLSGATGESWHVDHIIPLNGKMVSGLHIPDNLRVIRGKENLSKGNSL